jgi:DNA-binding MarR family transcriptional regulator
MREMQTGDLVEDFLGSANIFANAVSQVIERKFWHEATGNQLSVTHLKVLKLVGRSSPQTVSDVAAFLGVSNAAASKAVDGLVRRMLLRRAEGERDRRTMYLTLTGLGRRVIARYDEVTHQKLEAVFQSFVPDDLQHAIEVLDRLSVQIVNHLQEHEFCVQCGIYFRHDCPFRSHMQRQCLYLRQRERAGDREEGSESPRSEQTT